MRTTPGSLPVALSSFVGREEELERIARLLASARVVTLTGPGGAGKSRLAVEAGARLADRYPDGVWWVDLGVLADAGQVRPAVAAALGITPPPGIDAIDVVADHLAGQVALVVLDCCEHLTAPCAAVVETLTRRCRTLSVLATSRAPLGADGETVLPVPPLDLPEDDDPDALGRSAAVALFLDRARDRGVEIAPGSAVAELCRRLDGLPLAIELAAARARVLSPAQILAGLDDRLQLLDRTTQGSLTRHGSVWASVDWSHDLLSEPAQILLRRLAVFAGSFPLDAVEEVCSAPPLTDGLVDVVAGLVDHSLAQVDHSTEVARYRLLDTVRHYATWRLEASGEEPAFRDTHLERMVHVAETAAPGLEGRDQVTWLERLREHQPDLRAAGAWAARAGNVEASARLAAALWFFWLATGDTDSAGRAIAHLTPPPDTVDPTVRATLLLHAGGAAVFAGDTREGGERSRAALAIGETLEEPRITGRAQFQLAIGEVWTDPDRAARHLEAAIDACQDAGDELYLAMALSSLGLVEHLRGNTPRVGGLLDEGLAISRRTGNVLAIGNALMRVGFIACETGALREAVEALEEAIALSRGFGGDGMLASFQLPFLGRALTVAGDLDAARQVLDDAIGAAITSGFAQAHVFSLSYRGLLAMASEDHEQALSDLERAVELSEAGGFMFCEAQARSMAGIAEVLRGQPEAAAFQLGIAEDIARDTWAWPWTQAVLGRAALARLRDDLGEASRLALDALQLATGAGLCPEALDALDVLASTHGAAGRHKEATWLAAAADANRARLGVPRSPLARALSHLGHPASGQLDAAAAEAERAQGERATIADAIRYVTKGRGTRNRPAFGWDSLTPTELDVVALVAQGLTNPQIAQKLFVSPRTVQSHLRRVFSRLGVATRGELAAEAARHGL